MKKFLTTAATALVFLVFGLSLGVFLFFYRSLPKEKGGLGFPGLSADVKVVRDKWGVPHVFAENDRDLFFAVGFLHAQERIWQMELLRRAGYGRLSEVFGPQTLESDKFLRNLGLKEAARRDYENLDSGMKEALVFYGRGVNAWMSTRKYNWPPEFLLLRFRPEPWDVLDTILIKEIIALSLCADSSVELARAKLVEKLGLEKASQIIEEGVNVSSLEDIPSFEVDRNFLDFILEASNNWVLAGSRTVSGKPLLANDPHLKIALPPIWYELHMHSPSFNVVGVTFPGVPLVVIGHNEAIAWGVTNSFADVQDIYIEKLNEAKDSYLDGDEWKPLLKKEEIFRIRGEPEPARVEYSWTSRGPLLSPIIIKNDVPFSLAWTIYEGGKIVEAVYRLNRAQNWEEFCRALELWDAPSQNFVYADAAGNIGYYLSGKIPLRDETSALFPAPGWEAHNQWKGFLAESLKPTILNPESGYIITANQNIVPKGYPHYIGCSFEASFRAERIEELILQQEKHSVETFKKIQNDCLSKKAEFFLPFIRKIKASDEGTKRAQDILNGWTGEMTRGKEAALFSVFLNILEQATFEDELGQAFENFRGFFWRKNAGLQRILGDTGSPWFDRKDTPGVEGRDETVLSSLGKAYAWLEGRMGPPEKWDWMKLHALRYPHALGRIPLFRFFDRGPYPLDGDSFCVRASFPPGRSMDFATSHGASYRQIIDLADFRNSVSVLTSGQSGHFLSRHYDDQIPLWLKGEYKPMLFNPEDIGANAAAVLVLKAVSEKN